MTDIVIKICLYLSFAVWATLYTIMVIQQRSEIKKLKDTVNKIVAELESNNKKEG